jgi:hypothetical protein
MQNAKIKILRSLLQKCIDMIDAGNSNATDEELDELVDTLKYVTDKEIMFTKTQAADYLNVCIATFDNYRRCGWIPKPIKEKGGALKWKKIDLDKFIENKPF